MNRNVQLAVAAFVVIAVAAFGITGVALLLTDDEPADDDVIVDLPDIENPQYDADRVTSDRTPGTADIEMSSVATEKTVVVHAGSGLTQRDIAPLVNALIANGHEIELVGPTFQDDFVEPVPVFESDAAAQQGQPDDFDEPGVEELSEVGEKLEDAHGFVSLGVDSYEDEEREAIAEFVEDDGHVVMGIDPDQEFSMGGGLSDTFSALGAFTEPGYVYNLEENDLNYQRIYATPAGDGELTAGVGEVVFDTATPVQTANPAEVLEPLDGSELSTTREETDKPVLVRDGGVALVGDTGFMTPENTQRADNDQLVSNIADFLVESDRVVEDDDDEDDEDNRIPDDDDEADDDDDEVVTVAVGPDGENVFDPAVIEIEPGTTVVFEWHSDGHNLVPVFQQPDDLEWEGVEEIQDEGYVHEHTFEEDGIHEYVSEPHEEEFMFGTIIVGEPELEDEPP